MKILMLTCQYMPDVFGGAEKQCGRISKGIIDAECDVKILTSRQKWQGKSKEVVDGVEVRRIYSPIAPDLLGRWAIFSFNWLILVLLWGIINRKEIDVIHCHQGKYGAFVGCCLARLLKKPIVIKVGNSNQHMDFLALKSKMFIGPCMSNFVLNTHPTVVAISGVIAKNCADFGFKKIVRIPNSIDLSLLDKSEVTKTSSEPNKNNIRLFYHGRLENIKKIDVLLESFNLIAKKTDDIEFHLIGSGSVLNNAKQYILDNGLEEKVTCYGEVKDPVKFIQQFDIFVNASEAEGFSNSLLEALLSGKVLVSTPVSGASDAIKDGMNGYVASGFTPESIADSIEQGVELLRNDNGLIADFSEQLIENNFMVSIIAEKYLKLYNQL